MAVPERVLLTADTVGGVWTYALELARGLMAGGTRVALAAMGAPLGRDQKRDAQSVDRLSVFESNFRLEWMADPWEDIGLAGEWLLRLSDSFRPDIIHLNQYCFGALPFQAPVLVAGHSCVLSWWRSVHGGDAPAEWDRYREQVTRGLRGAALIATPSCAMLTALQQHYGPLSRTLVIPNGREAPRALMEPKQPFIFAAGRLWDEAKNLAALEQIAPALPWPVYVAGGLHHPNGAIRHCSDCRFLGKLPARQVEWWMERASIYVLPARYEPFGLSALEAALRGCALVLGDIPSLREVWGDAAVFVSPSDHQALCEATSALIESPELRLDYARRARSRASEFSASRMVDGYHAAYASLI
jgi:glycogen synthase